MRSRLPKVLHRVAGRPAVAWVVEAARRVGCERILLVVGHGAGEVRAAVPGRDVTFVEQLEQRGTGDAVLRTAEALAGTGPALALVLSGDAPLVRPATLELLIREAAAGWGALAVARLDPPAEP
ncbi:MAG TPA: NTP transferase domain-containing protein, partial [Thermoanaerobaculia bacterium]|nr:NTP transferase domain-containing protein [Thermoanaerobaculia bacterium]